MKMCLPKASPYNHSEATRQILCIGLISISLVEGNWVLRVEAAHSESIRDTLG